MLGAGQIFILGALQAVKMGKRKKTGQCLARLLVFARLHSAKVAKNLIVSGIPSGLYVTCLIVNGLARVALPNVICSAWFLAV